MKTQFHEHKKNKYLLVSKSKIIFLISTVLVLLGCSSDQDTALQNPSQSGQNRQSQNSHLALPYANKIVLLKVDFVSHTFESGKEMVFKNAQNFTIASDYQSPGDFGGVSLKYAELNATFFEGTIHWMGLGQMEYPQQLDGVDAFQTIGNPVPMPDAALLSTVAYTEFAYYPDPVPYNEIWDAIKNLQVVAQYRSSNPGSTVNVFLYTPSVGIGNPEEWDYFVILKN